MNRAKAVSIMLTALLLLLLASVALASYSPELQVDDQPLVDGSITVAKATVDGPGWVAIYTDDNGEPGEVIGYAPLMTGINANIPVELDADAATETLHAVLHEDLGFAGTFEYPGDDVPVDADDELVSVAFQIIDADEAVEDEAADEAMAEPTPVLDEIGNQVAAFAQQFLTLRQEEPTADEAVEEEAVAEEEEAAVEEPAEEAEEAVEAEAADAEDATAEEAAAEEEMAEEPAVEEAAVEEAAVEEATEEVAAESEETAPANGMAQQVGAFVQSFLTLSQEEPAEEAVAEEAAEEETVEEEAAPAVELMDIVDTAINAGSFETLVSALESADLVEALKGEGPFTVFAPTDAAFDAVPEELLAALQADPEMLVQTLLYHVVPDKLMADDIAMMGSALTLEGDMLPFSVDGDAVMAGEANVAAADIEAANGVIHIIDKVLLPPALAEAVAEPVVEEEPEPEAVQSISAGYQESDGSSVVVDSVVSAGDGWVSIRLDESFSPGEDVLGYTDVPAGESSEVVIELDTPLTENAMVWAVLHVDDGEAGVFEYPDGDAPAMYNRSIVMGPFNVALAAEEAMAEEETASEEVEETDDAVEPEAEEEAAPAEGIDLSGMAEVAGAAMQNLLGALQPGEEMAEGDDAMAEKEDDGEMAEGDDAMAEKEDDGEMAEGEDAMAEKDDDGEMAEGEDAMAEKEDDGEMAAAPEALPETGLNLATGGATVPVVVLVLGMLVAGAFVTRRRPA